MEFLIGIIAMPVVFWTLLLIEVVWMFAAMNNEDGGSATWCLGFIGVYGIIEAGGIKPAIHFIMSNGIILGIAAFIMLAYGLCWSLFKWRLMADDKAKKIEAYIEEHGRSKSISYFSQSYTSITHGLRVSSMEEIENSNFACLAPQFKDNKKKIVFWVTYCIPSTIWFLVNDPIRRIVNYIVESMKFKFQSISTGVFDSTFKTKEK